MRVHDVHTKAQSPRQLGGRARGTQRGLGDCFLLGDVRMKEGLLQKLEDIYLYLDPYTSVHIWTF